jgi:hypothetical protein
MRFKSYVVGRAPVELFSPPSAVQPSGKKSELPQPNGQKVPGPSKPMLAGETLKRACLVFDSRVEIGTNQPSLISG